MTINLVRLKKGWAIALFCCIHKLSAAISARIESPLFEQGLIRVKLNFPYASGGNGDTGTDWSQPERHSSELSSSSNTATIRRQLDEDSYSVQLAWSEDGEISEKEAHYFYWSQSLVKTIHF